MKKKRFYSRQGILLYPDWFLCHFCDQEFPHDEIWAFLVGSRAYPGQDVSPICNECQKKKENDFEGVDWDERHTSTGQSRDPKDL